MQRDFELWLIVKLGVDKGLSTFLTLQEAAMLVTSIHIIAVPENANCVIDSRNIAYVVLPALLMRMTLEPECIGLECVHRFIANLQACSTAIYPSDLSLPEIRPALTFFSYEEERQSTAFDYLNSKKRD